MVVDPINHPSILQWNSYRPNVQQRHGTNESPDLFPTVNTGNALGNQILPPTNNNPQSGAAHSASHGAHSPVHQLHQQTQQHDFNSPTSTSSSFSQPKHHTFDDYRYSHSSTNWLYGNGANVQPVHPNSEFQLDTQHNTNSFGEVSTSFNGEDSSKPRTESSLSSITSPEYSSILDGDENSPRETRGRSSSTSHSSKSKIYKDATGKTKRSRMGCLTCRHRKKRCCERRPRCQECERLGLKCTWPVPGLEHRNRPKNSKMNDDMHYDAFYGHIKILRGIVEYRINATS